MKYGLPLATPLAGAAEGVAACALAGVVALVLLAVVALLGLLAAVAALGLLAGDVPPCVLARVARLGSTLILEVVFCAPADVTAKTVAVATTDSPTRKPKRILFFRVSCMRLSYPYCKDRRRHSAPGSLRNKLAPSNSDRKPFLALQL